MRRGIWNDRGVRRASGLLGYLGSLSATARAVLLAAGVGFVVVLVASLFGPGLFAGDEEPERVVAASVTEPAPCTAAGAKETVTFTDGGAKKTAVLPACGHEKGEKLEVAVPTEPEPGTLTVRSAETEAGYSSVRRSIGLLLMALACVGGGLYAYLVTRAVRRPARHTRPAPVS